MYKVLSLRNRVSKLLIFGLISLLLYGYHCITSNDIYHLRMLPTSRQSHGSHVGSSIPNAKGEDEKTSSVVNVISEPENLQVSAQSKSKYLPPLDPSSSASASLLVSSAMLKNGENPEVEEPPERQKLTGNPPTPVGSSDSILAIDQADNSVPMEEACPEFGADLKLLILIMSAPQNAEARKAIRLTWGHFGQRKDVRIYFFLGNTTETEAEEVVLNEQEIYGDIIIKNFVDSYSNLTRKVISALEWVCDNCSEVKFVLKTDDDMFINVPRLLEFIKNHSKEKNVIFGRLATGWKPHRNVKDKYHVPVGEFNRKVFPRFTTGPAYLMSGDVVPKLYKTALKEHFLRLEDAFITGVVAQKLGIARKGIKEFMNQRISFIPCKIQKAISIHGVKYSEQFDLWKKLLDGVAKC